MDPNRMVKLKNGIEEPYTSVQITMRILKGMMTSGKMPQILAVVDLVHYCRGGSPVPVRSRELLFEFGLLDQDGHVHDIIKDVVESSAVGEGLVLQLVSPYAEE